MCRLYLGSVQPRAGLKVAAVEIVPAQTLPCRRGEHPLIRARVVPKVFRYLRNRESRKWNGAALPRLRLHLL
jgi:hypothetical protein